MLLIYLLTSESNIDLMWKARLTGHRHFADSRTTQVLELYVNYETQNE